MDLIQIQPRQFGEDTVQTVNARDLHAFLGVRRDFTTWVKAQIKRAGLSEHIDFEKLTQKGELSPTGQWVSEYFLTIESAKHIAMMSQTDKGFEVRDYFLECERLVKSVPSITMEIHARVMAYERRDKVTLAMAKRASRDMLARKEALKDLREEKALLEDITQLRLALSSEVSA